MSGPSFISLLAALLLVGGPAAAEPPAERKFLGEGPVVITSDSMVADRKAGKALFRGSVKAESGGTTLASDNMTVYYDAEEGGIVKVDAVGSVKLTKDGQVVVSERAIYVEKGQRIVFTGNPKAIEGSNVVSGSKITYLLVEDRFIVEESKVFLEQPSGGGGE